MLTLTESTQSEDTSNSNDNVDSSIRSKNGNMPLFSHEQLDPSNSSEAVPIVQHLENDDSKRHLNPSNINTGNAIVTNDPADDIFSPVVDHTQAPVPSLSHLSPTPLQRSRDNIHTSSPRPQPLQRVIRRTRSEILSRSTNIRPPLHQIIEEDSVPDFRYPRSSDTSLSPLLGKGAATISTDEAADKGTRGSAVEHGTRDGDEGVRQRKVSGGTADGPEGRKDDGDEDGMAGVGSGNRNDSIHSASGVTMLSTPEQQHEDKKDEGQRMSIWQWLLGCLRRRST